MHRVVKSLKPTIAYSLSSIGAVDDPRMRRQAEIFAADAVRRYDPNQGTNLRTWTTSQLQRIQRYKRENAGAIRVPDRARQDAYHLALTEAEYVDQHGEEPDLEQLSDKAAMSIDRIRKVRALTRPVVAEGALGSDAHSLPDYDQEALSYVYQESGKENRKLIELVLGYGGNPPMSQAEAAKRLGMSTAQVSRRLAGLQFRTQEILTDLNETF